MKLTIYLTAIAALLMLWACTEDPYSAEPVSGNMFKVSEEKKSLKPMFFITRNYKMFLKLDLPDDDFDTLIVTAHRLKDTTKVFNFKDDGISPDFISGNGIWTAEFIPAFTDTVHNDSIKVTAKLYHSNGNIETSSFKKVFRVKNPEAPVSDSLFIDSLRNNGSLASNFTPFSTRAYLRDNDNYFGYFDTLTYKLIFDKLDLSGTTKTLIYKTLSKQKKDTCNFNFKFMPNIASGLKTGQYNMRMEIRDSFDKLACDTIFNNINVINTPPVLSNLVAPDSVEIPSSPGIVYFKITVKVIDHQGASYNENDDLKPLYLKITGNSNGYLMNDKAENGDAQAGDGIFTYQFYCTENQTPLIFSYNLQAEDKAGNISNVIEGTMTLYKKTKVIKGKK